MAVWQLLLPLLSVITHGESFDIDEIVVLTKKLMQLTLRKTNVLYLAPRFFTYNFLSEKIPKQDTPIGELGRRALLGFCSSAVSDTCSNSIRVVKVYKQSSTEAITYPQVVRKVIAESGVTGLMFRGLETKIFSNGLQGILFSILWKHFEEVLFPKKK